MQLARGQNALGRIVLHEDHDSSEIGEPEIHGHQAENVIKRQKNKLLDFTVIERGNSLVLA